MLAEVQFDKRATDKSIYHFFPQREILRLSANYNHGMNQFWLAFVENSLEDSLLYYRNATQNLSQDDILKAWSLAFNEKEEFLEQTLLYLVSAAENGNVLAQKEVAKCFKMGRGVPHSPEKAFYYLKLAADAGDRESQLSVAKQYFFGHYVEKSISKALHYLDPSLGSEYLNEEAALKKIKILADKGTNPTAQFLIGASAESGIETYHYYIMAAQNGHKDALRSLGDCFLEGRGVKKSLESAVLYYMESAAREDVSSLRKLGDLYCKDMTWRLPYYTLAANRGDPTSQKIVGDFYFNLTERNYEEAIHYYQLAADQNVVNVYYNLATCYDYKKSFDLASKYFLLSSQAGNRKAQEIIQSPETLTFLGRQYLFGDKVPLNEEKAIEFFLQAAGQGDAEAKAFLGYCYEKGKGTKIDLEKAVEWYREAAKQDNAMGQQLLGACYENGRGVVKSPESALYYYSLAAQKQSLFALFKIGWCYEQGIGVERDGEKAVHYFTSAAEMGDVQSVYHLGRCYAKGFGVPQDERIAFEYFTRAAEMGSLNATNEVAKCYRDGIGVVKSEQNYLYYSNLVARANAEASEIDLGDQKVA